MTTLSERRPEAIEPEVFLSNHHRIQEWMLKVDEMKASGKSAAQAAKASGVNLKAYLLTKKLSKMEREDAESLIRDALLYARLLDLGLFAQEDLFPALGDNSAFLGLTSKVMGEHRAWEAEQAGYEAGKLDDPLDNNPHPVGTELHQRYVVGWHNGASYRTEAEARGEKIIKPRKKGQGNPEDNNPED